MNILMIGTGYVGFISGLGFAEFGFKVSCFDKDQTRMNLLKGGKIPFYEPGLKNMFDKNWIELLNKGLDVNCGSPTERARIWDKDDSGHTMFYDTLGWRKIEEYKNFIFNSPAAQI